MNLCLQNCCIVIILWTVYQRFYDIVWYHVTHIPILNAGFKWLEPTVISILFWQCYKTIQSCGLSTQNQNILYRHLVAWRTWAHLQRYFVKCFCDNVSLFVWAFNRHSWFYPFSIWRLSNGWCKMWLQCFAEGHWLKEDCTQGRSISACPVSPLGAAPKPHLLYLHWAQCGRVQLSVWVSVSQRSPSPWTRYLRENIQRGGKRTKLPTDVFPPEAQWI